MLFYVLGCVKFMCLGIPAINEVKFIVARDYNMSTIILKLLFVKNYIHCNQLNIWVYAPKKMEM